MELLCSFELLVDFAHKNYKFVSSEITEMFQSDMPSLMSFSCFAWSRFVFTSLGLWSYFEYVRVNILSFSLSLTASKKKQKASATHSLEFYVLVMCGLLEVFQAAMILSALISILLTLICLF